MTVNIKSVGMEKGSQYETVITTISPDGSKNAAPIGTIAYSENELMMRIFTTSHTAQNIIKNREFISNITNNPKIFTLSTIGDLPEEYFTNDDFPVLKDCDAYLKCKVTTLKEARKKNDPVNSDGLSIVVKAEVKEIVKNKECPQIVNRGLYMLIESLVNYTRIDMVDDDLKEYYINRFHEDKRVVKKVGTNREKEAIDILEKQLKENGYNV